MFHAGDVSPCGQTCLALHTYVIGTQNRLACHVWLWDIACNGAWHVMHKGNVSSIAILLACCTNKVGPAHITSRCARRTAAAISMQIQLPEDAHATEARSTTVAATPFTAR